MKIDECDEDLIRDHNWSLSNGYLRTRIDGVISFLHRVIAERMGLDCLGQIDHEDRDKENNHRDNLRSATRSQNGMNRKISSNNTSGVTGVYWHKTSKKWRARLTSDGRRIHLGNFKHKKAAIKVRKEAEIKYFGEYRRK